MYIWVKWDIKKEFDLDNLSRGFAGDNCLQGKLLNYFHSFFEGKIIELLPKYCAFIKSFLEFIFLSFFYLHEFVLIIKSIIPFDDSKCVNLILFLWNI
jgi:hypothetical protein